MIVASYIALLAALLLWARDRKWIQRPNGRTVVAVRIAGCVVCVLLMLVGFFLLANGARGVVSVAVGFALIASASALILGIGVWEGGFARSLRVAGWLVVVLVLCFPSTLTLLLLLFAPMVVLLERVRSTPRSRERNAIVQE